MYIIYVLKHSLKYLNSLAVDKWQKVNIGACVHMSGRSYLNASVTTNHLQAGLNIPERNAAAASAQYLHFKSLAAAAVSWAEASK